VPTDLVQKEISEKTRFDLFPGSKGGGSVQRVAKIWGATSNCDGLVATVEAE
jgi:hypothetical protein